MEGLEVNWRGKNVFITGANGFIGSWLANDLIEKKANVTAVVLDPNEHGNLKILNLQNKLKIVNGDLADENIVNKIFKENEFDSVFHLAAQAIVSVANNDPIPTFKSNIEGTWNLMEACRNSDSIERIVVASSDKAYGEHKKLPYKEDASLLPKYPYDVSKACADLIARSYFFTYSLPVAITRCANIYGPADMNFSRIVPDMISSILKNKTPVIRSNGTPERDYLFVKDAVSGYLVIAENLDKKEVQGEVFNIGNEKPVKVIDLFNKIAEMSGKADLKPEILGKGKLKGEIDRQFLDVAKIKNLLNWKAKVSLEEGLNETIRWYKENET